MKANQTLVAPNRGNPILTNRAACGQGGVQVVISDDFFTDQEHAFRAFGICSATCDAEGISMAQGFMPPQSEGHFHAHASATAIRIDIGIVIVEWIDDDGETHAKTVHAGGYIYVPPSVQHRPVNPFATACVYTVSRNSEIAD